MHWYPRVKILDIGGGFPAPYDKHVRPFRELAKTINTELKRLFLDEVEIVAEPGRFFVATAVAGIVGKAVRDGKQCYYVNDGVYHTFSGVIFDHISYHFQAFKRGPTQVCSVFGLTCDALDTISLAEELPDLELGDFIYSKTSVRILTPRQHISTASRRPRSSTSIASVCRRTERRDRHHRRIGWRSSRPTGW